MAETKFDRNLKLVPGWHFTEALAELLATNAGMAQGGKADRKRVAKELINQAFLSHAPVVDAERLGYLMADHAFDELADDETLHSIKGELQTEFAQLITDNIEAQGIRVKK